MDRLSVFNSSRLLVSSLNFFYFFYFSLSLSFSFSFHSRLLSFSFTSSRYGHMRGSNCFIQLQDIRNDLEAIMKWVHIAEKACKSPIKRKKDWPTTLVCSKFYFSAFYDSYVFSYEFNKGLECSKSSIEIVYHLLIWAMRETPIYYLCLLSLFFLFFFFFSFFFHAM